MDLSAVAQSILDGPKNQRVGDPATEHEAFTDDATKKKENEVFWPYDEAWQLRKNHNTREGGSSPQKRQTRKGMAL